MSIDTGVLFRIKILFFYFTVFIIFLSVIFFLCYNTIYTTSTSTVRKRIHAQTRLYRVTKLVILADNFSIRVVCWESCLKIFLLFFFFKWNFVREVLHCCSYACEKVGLWVACVCVYKQRKWVACVYVGTCMSKDDKRERGNFCNIVVSIVLMSNCINFTWKRKI